MSIWSLFLELSVVLYDKNTLGLQTSFNPSYNKEILSFHFLRGKDKSLFRLD